MTVDDPLDHPLGDRLGAATASDVDLELGASQAGGDLERLEVDPGADLAQRLRDL